MPECPICYDLIEGDDLETLSRCGHSFHYECILREYINNQEHHQHIKVCPLCRTYGSYLSNKTNCIPIRNIHNNYNVFMDYIKQHDIKMLQLFFIKERCHAILNTGEYKNQQCRYKHKENSVFCGRHNKIL
jgi:hypothetical protein